MVATRDRKWSVETQLRIGLFTALLIGRMMGDLHGMEICSTRPLEVLRQINGNNDEWNPIRISPVPYCRHTVIAKVWGMHLRNTKKRLINSVWAGYYKLKSEVETSPAMPVFETFAKRMRKSRGELPDVYTYDSIPEPLRIQIVQIMTEVLGDGDAYRNNLGVVTG